MATAQEPTREQQARRTAALARIRTYGDPVLRSRARAVPAVDAAIAAQIRAMTQLLEDAMEAGLAAPSSGSSTACSCTGSRPTSPSDSARCVRS